MSNRDDLIILTVDDDFINLKLIKSILLKTKRVKEVIEAKDGSEAVDILKSREDIDLVLLDIIMPIMNGIEVLQVVRSDESLKQLPIIVLTTDETRKSQAMDNGANGFITKPVKSDELLRQIYNMID